MKNIIKFFIVFPFALGIFLSALNIIGLFSSLRNPEIYNLKTAKGKVTLTQKEFYDAIKRGNETDEEYIYKINDAVFRGVAHYWEDNGIDKYHLRVPIYENFILWFASIINPKTYLKYEYCDLTKAVERGVGLCSEQAIITSTIMSKQGFKTKIASLGGHVVPFVQTKDGKWWKMGPDYGTIIPNSLEEIENNPEIIRPYYESKYGKELADTMVKIFGKEDNKVFYGAEDYCGDKIIIEKTSYVLIWIIPIVLMMPFLINRLLKKLSVHTPKTSLS